MKNDLILFLGLLGVALGGMIIFQFNTDIAYTSNFPTDELEAREELIKSFLDEQSYLQSRIVSLRTQIDEAQEEIEDQSETGNLALLKSLEKSIGLSEQTGQGLEIVLDDSHFADRGSDELTPKDVVQASDLRDIINALDAAHAEAVSVNDQRIIATSAISSVGSNILVNNAHIAPPFVIKAVGDPEIMIRSLTNKDLLSDLYSRIEMSQLEYTITIEDFVSIPIYNGDLKTLHLNLVEQ
ncbi:DUF881 domain-containing protein [Candidatus Peregrinibacteria bacterium]|nr:DUF881 domain-containing protein [Candidatus Peregrinibacteria bacterium]